MGQRLAMKGSKLRDRLIDRRQVDSNGGLGVGRMGRRDLAKRKRTSGEQCGGCRRGEGIMRRVNDNGKNTINKARKCIHPAENIFMAFFIKPFFFCAT